MNVVALSNVFDERQYEIHLTDDKTYPYFAMKTIGVRSEVRSWPSSHEALQWVLR